jgi:hypothetical protein
MADEKEDKESGDGWLGKVGLILGIVAGIPAALIAAYQLYQIVIGKETIQTMFEQKPQTVVVQGGAIVAPANCAEAAEKASWEKATTEKSRTAFSAYLASYQNCPNAQRARDILQTSCKKVTTSEWKSSPMFQSNQGAIGVGASCAAAKKDANQKAKNNCEELVQGGGFRNAQWKVSDGDCTSDRVSDTVTMYRVDLPVSCTWEQNVPEETEVCG